MVSTTHSLCHRSTRLNQNRNTSVLIRAVQQSTSSTSLKRRNKQIMARSNYIGSVISRRRAKQKTQRRKLVLKGSRKASVVQIVKKLQKLRRLVSGGDSDSTKIDDLFCAAADYILTLQMKVRVMEYMVSMFTPQDPDN